MRIKVEWNTAKGLWEAIHEGSGRYGGGTTPAEAIWNLLKFDAEHFGVIVEGRE